MHFRGWWKTYWKGEERERGGKRGATKNKNRGDIIKMGLAEMRLGSIFTMKYDIIIYIDHIHELNKQH